MDRVRTKHPLRNVELRMFIAEQGISYKQIAQKIKRSQSQLSQIMQSDMPDWWRQLILGAIAEIREERGDFNVRES